VVIEEDSCIVFTLEQSKTMIEWDIRYNECRTNLELTSNESAVKDSIISTQQVQIEEYQKIDSTYQLLNQENEELREILEEERQLLNKEIRRQKRQKWFVGIGGFFTTAVATYFYIKK
jgi:hypothetical protein